MSRTAGGGGGAAAATAATIVVVAKCPLPGASKTRLVELLGGTGSAALAQALLSDVVTAISHCPELQSVGKILLYAPPDEEGLDMMRAIFVQLGILEQWTLHPVVQQSASSSRSNLRSAELSEILTNAVEVARGRRHPDPTTVVLLGMDAPELNMAELVAACSSSPHNAALLCPAADGGYGLLSLPPSADAAAVFDGVVWSHPSTALSQLKALSDAHVAVVVGPQMHDIDTPDDVRALVARLLHLQQQRPPAHAAPAAADDDGTPAAIAAPSHSLSRPSAWATTTAPDPLPGSSTTTCQYTRQALVRLGLL